MLMERFLNLEKKSQSGFNIYLLMIFFLASTLVGAFFIPTLRRWQYKHFKFNI